MTTAPAPTTVFSPMVTPGQITTLPPNQLGEGGSVLAGVKAAARRVACVDSGCGRSELIESGTSEAVTAAFSWNWVLDQLPSS